MTLAIVFNAFIATAKGRHPNAKDGLWWKAIYSDGVVLLYYTTLHYTKLHYTTLHYANCYAMLYSTILPLLLILLPESFRVLFSFGNYTFFYHTLPGLPNLSINEQRKWIPVLVVKRRYRRENGLRYSTQQVQYFSQLLVLIKYSSNNELLCLTYVRYKGICWKVEIEKLNTTDNATAPVLTNQRHSAWHPLEGDPGARRSIWLLCFFFNSNHVLFSRKIAFCPFINYVYIWRKILTTQVIVYETALL